MAVATWVVGDWPGEHLLGGPDAFNPLSRVALDAATPAAWGLARILGADAIATFLYGVLRH